MQVEIAIYPGKTQLQLDYYTKFFDLENVAYNVEQCYFGNRIVVNTNKDFLKSISYHTCRFIFDFYLKEAVLNKIYDEYYDLSTEDASLVLNRLLNTSGETLINDNILKLILTKHSINTESYCIFNIKTIMICFYAMTDKFCMELIDAREEERLMSIIKTFSVLNFDGNMSADAEFSTDDNK